MSRVLEYEVGDAIHPVDNWIEYIKERGERVNEGEDEFSKEVKGKEEASLVEKFTFQYNLFLPVLGHLLSLRCYQDQFFTYDR